MPGSSKAAVIAPVPRPNRLPEAAASPFDSLGSPWKRSPAPPVQHHPAVNASEYPAVNGHTTKSSHEEPSRQPSRVPQGVPADQQVVHSIQSPIQETDARHRARSGSFNRDGRVTASGDARYQYEQNTYDRHWQNPLPQTREIYNSATGRLEQIESTQKQVRQLSHPDRKSADVLPRPQAHSGDARLGNNHAAVLVSSNSKAILVVPEATSTERAKIDLPAPLATVSHAETAQAGLVVTSPADPKPSEAPSLDPSSQEFIDMQKKLMAERREQAIQRRKDQEAEEISRKERARKKAEELAVLADKEKAEKAELAAKEAQKAEMMRPKIIAKPPPRTPALTVERSVNVQKATSTVMQANSQMKETQPDKRKSATTDNESWQRGTKLPDRNHNESRQIPEPRSNRRAANERPAQTVRDSPIDVDDTVEDLRQYESVSRAAWGPIGSKKFTGTDSARELAADNLRKEKTPSISASMPSSPARSSGVEQSASQPSWSAFDGIAQARRNVTNAVEPREYNVFDTADEILIPERNRQSPQNQAQNRTSSRFFPSPASVPPIKTPKSDVPFVSPILPPMIDSIANPHFESPDTAPTLALPGAAISHSISNGFMPFRSIDQVLSSVRQSMSPATPPKDAKASKSGFRAWFDIQTRSVWEIKPLKDGQAPRVRVPYSEKTLDWSRKERPIAEAQAATKPVERSLPSSTTAMPSIPAWSLPKDLETTTKSSSIAEPLIPPTPALRLPETTVTELQPLKRNKSARFEVDRTSRFYTTRLSLTEEPDNMSPIRIKTTEAENKVARKFGKRVDTAQNSQKKQADVKRQPVNMSDAPGGTGFKRGFANRTRTPQNASSIVCADESGAPKVVDGRSSTSSPAPVASRGSSTPVSIMQRSGPLPTTNNSRPASTGPNGQSKQNVARVTRSPRPQVGPHNKALQDSGFGTAHQQMQHPQTLPVTQQPPVSRVGPPGLAGPLTNMKHDDGSATGMSPYSAPLPTPTPRGPPGIVLP